MDRAETGRRGERAAALYYIRRGCTLLEHNYCIRGGEIDLILRDPAGVIIICEVKTRLSDKFGSAAEAVVRAKEQK